MILSHGFSLVTNVFHPSSSVITVSHLFSSARIASHGSLSVIDNEKRQDGRNVRSQNETGTCDYVWSCTEIVIGLCASPFGGYAIENENDCFVCPSYAPSHGGGVSYGNDCGNDYTICPCGAGCGSGNDCFVCPSFGVSQDSSGGCANGNDSHVWFSAGKSQKKLRAKAWHQYLKHLAVMVFHRPTLGIAFGGVCSSRCEGWYSGGRANPLTEYIPFYTESRYEERSSVKLQHSPAIRPALVYSLIPLPLLEAAWWKRAVVYAGSSSGSALAERDLEEWG